MAGGRSSGSDLNDVVRQLAAVAQQLARNSTGNGDAQGELFKKVAQSKPLTYQGEPDPVALENWLREFEKLFGDVGCPENSKVGCATYYLRGEADLWWQQNEATIRALPGFNWTKFQEKVRDKFYPSFLQKQKTEEFSNLRMDKMTVTEHYTKFIGLSRFAEGSFSTEKAKARKCESGLTTDLQLKLCGQVFETLDEVYGRVVHLYALEEKKKKELAEIEGRHKRKEVGQVSGNQQGNQNGFKKKKYHHNNNFLNNNFQNNNRQGGRSNNGGTRNNNQEQKPAFGTGFQFSLQMSVPPTHPSPNQLAVNLDIVKSVENQMSKTTQMSSLRSVFTLARVHAPLRRIVKRIIK